MHIFENITEHCKARAIMKCYYAFIVCVCRLMSCAYICSVVAFIDNVKEKWRV